jgi:hypothetical protein
MANKLELNWTGKHDSYALIRDEATGKRVQVPYDEVQPRLLVEAGGTAMSRRITFSSAV